MSFSGQHCRDGGGLHGTFQQSPARLLPEPKSSQTLLGTITSTSIATSEIDRNQFRTEDVNQVASYNWKETTTATILVPGKAA